MLKYNSQAQQDKFVLSVLKNKRNGFFIEIGSNHPKKINNTYILEKTFNWNGIMFEYNKKWLPLYKKERKNSIHIIGDATKIDYKKIFEDNNTPKNIDYLQLDLEAINGSTLKALEKMETDGVLDQYKFATITFEHDVYHTNKFDIRNISRNILLKRGYIIVLEDVHLFEDWYVHPDLVDMEYVKKIREINKDKYKDCKKLRHYKKYKNMPNIKNAIDYKDIRFS